MILINDVHKRVLDLSRKGRSGYLNAEEFTRHCNEAQDLLFRFNYKQYEEGQIITDALRPFIKREEKPLINSVATIPVDYRHKVSVSVLRIVDSKFKEYPLEFIRNHEVGLTQNSHIRKPRIEEPRSWRYYISGDSVHVIPKMEAMCRLTYLMEPPRAVYSVVVDGTTDEEDFDPLTSVNLLWEAQETTNLVDLILFLLGFQTKDSELMEFARKNLITQNSIQ
jgi:hypothetical protein